MKFWRNKLGVGSPKFERLTILVFIRLEIILSRDCSQAPGRRLLFFTFTVNDAEERLQSTPWSGYSTVPVVVVLAVPTTEPCDTICFPFGGWGGGGLRFGDIKNYELNFPRLPVSHETAFFAITGRARSAVQRLSVSGSNRRSDVKNKASIRALKIDQFECTIPQSSPGSCPQPYSRHG